MEQKDTFLQARRDRILKFLERKRMTQVALANELGITRAYMNHIVSGRKVGSAETLADLERFSKGRLKVINMAPPRVLPEQAEAQA